MALRSQLLLVSSLTLALPWAGCQYVKEMESTLRQGQINALEATAKAVSSRISLDPELMSDVALAAGGEYFNTPSSVHYVHDLPNSILWDGYIDDWRNLNLIKPWSFDQNSPQLESVMGSYGDQAYLMLKVKEKTIKYFSPANTVSASDHIRLRLSSDRESWTYRLYTAAPGQVIVEKKQADQAWLRDHKVVGIWTDISDFYTLEIKLPLALLEGKKLAIHRVNGDDDLLKQATQSPRNLPLVIAKPRFSKVLSVFERPGVKLQLTSLGGWMLGRSGKTQVVDSIQGKSMTPRILQRVISKPDLPSFPGEVRIGQLQGLEISLASEGQKHSQWYRDGNRSLGRVAIPVIDVRSQEIRGIVVAEESTDFTQAMTSGAIGRLMFYSSIAMMVAISGLLAYASYLSFRIRQLSRDALAAVDTDGRIRGTFVASSRSDEIGDLSRMHASLLDRLRRYTSYLETLSGKLSHELRTPLAVVRSSLDNLESFTLEQQQKVYLERASVGTARLSAILDAMSSASRLEQSIDKTEYDQVNLSRLLSEVSDAYSDVYAPVSITFLGALSGESLVMGSADLLVQMLDKLVENAVDFTGSQGEIVIEEILEKEEAKIRVINSGPPLPEKYEQQIFDSLVSERERKSESLHLGLGLYIVRLIVHFHRGDICAYNHPDGNKVVFEISLPISKTS